MLIIDNCFLLSGNAAVLNEKTLIFIQDLMNYNADGELKRYLLSLRYYYTST